MAVDISALIGKPFVDGGRGPGAYDCWGLVMEVFRVFGQELPDYRISAYNYVGVGAQIMAGMADARRGHDSIWQELETPEAPCIVAIKNHPRMVNHCGAYIGGGRFLHVMERIGCVQDRIDSPMWRRRIMGFFRPKHG